MTEAVIAELNENETEVLVKALDGLRKFFRQYWRTIKKQIIKHPIAQRQLLDPGRFCITGIFNTDIY